TDQLKALRSTPLMLALLCNLYRTTGYLPRRRVDVYHACAQLLLSQWDERKGIRLSSRAVSAVLKQLAYWMYFTLDAQAGVARSERVRRISDYLIEDDWVSRREDARDRAEHLVAYMTGRAWIMTAVGADMDEEIYWFTYRSLLEYFA